METNSIPNLTPTEGRCLVAIDKVLQKNTGRKITHQMVADRLKRSQWAASRTINKLVDKRVARCDPKKKRSLEITESGYRWLRVTQ